MRFLLFITSLLLFLNCGQKEKKLNAQQIVDQSIENAGGTIYDNATVNFDFRNTAYESYKNGGDYKLSRSFIDSLGEIKDVLTNAGFQRSINGEQINIPDSTASKYANSVNSVHYFVQLPYGLNAAAVKKELIGETEIGTKKYFEIKVTFKQDGGGLDHEDEYLYWIEMSDFTVDYFAYKYYTGEGGIRFRKAYNPRIVNGIRFVDYANYKVEPWESVELKTIPALFENNKLELLSQIKTENVKVEVNTNIAE